jgi:protein SCO1/2
MRWLASLLLALVAGASSLYGLTDGFTALTAESARRQSVARHPRLIPNVAMLDQDGQVFSLHDELAKDGRVAIISFFYSRCISLCLAQGFLTERLQNAIDVSGLRGKIRLISISFDPRDRADALKRYSARMHANPSVWQMWSFAEPAHSNDILRLFGITVVPAPLGEFEHNAAYHVVTPDGKLVSIVDDDDPGLAFEQARRQADDLQLRGPKP